MEMTQSSSGTRPTERIGQSLSWRRRASVHGDMCPVPIPRVKGSLAHSTGGSLSKSCAIVGSSYRVDDGRCADWNERAHDGRGTWAKGRNNQGKTHEHPHCHEYTGRR